MEVVLLADVLLFEARIVGSSLSECSIDKAWELLDEMATVLTCLGSFTPVVPGNELGDQLVISLKGTGESLLQSVWDNSSRDTPDGPGTGVCQPRGKSRKGTVNVALVIKTDTREITVHTVLNGHP